VPEIAFQAMFKRVCRPFKLVWRSERLPMLKYTQNIVRAVKSPPLPPAMLATLEKAYSHPDRSELVAQARATRDEQAASTRAKRPRKKPELPLDTLEVTPPPLCALREA
jgi:hypothetical protein